MVEFQFKKFLSWVLVGIVILWIGFFVFRHFSGEKSLKLIFPQAEEELRAGKTYQISWKSKNIGKVGIMLVKDKEPRESEWIVKDFPAGKRKYDWQIFVWQEPRQDYKISIFEYPWQEGSKIDYSNKNFTILGPQFASCDSLSVEAEWPYLPNDFPNLRKVFITKYSFSGNLGGLAGADQKCQTEAEEKGFSGTWKAFLGDDTNLAVDRLNLEGIFVEAKAAALLPEEKTCHRLLGKNFDQFFRKLSAPVVFNQERLALNREDEFLNNLNNIWLGRVNKESRRDCVTIFTNYPIYDPSLNYSFTTTCQDWTTSQRIVPSYKTKQDEKIEFPSCYTPEGQRINAVALAGLSLGVIEKAGVKSFTFDLGKSCDNSQKLLCIQQ